MTTRKFVVFVIGICVIALTYDWYGWKMLVILFLWFYAHNLERHHNAEDPK